MKDRGPSAARDLFFLPEAQRLHEALQFPAAHGAVRDHIAANPLNLETILCLLEVERGRTKSEQQASSTEQFKGAQRKGSAKQKEYAAETWRIVHLVDAETRKHPLSANMGAWERAGYIVDRLAALGRHQTNGLPYSQKTVHARISRKRKQG